MLNAASIWVDCWCQPNAPAAQAETPLSLDLLLFLPALGLTFPGLYARETPEPLEVPFFYWYQVAWVLLSAIITAVVYRATPE